MNEKNDKTTTFEFDRIKDSESYKTPVERKKNDVYSEARKTNYRAEDYYDDKSDKKLVSVIIILIALLIMATAAGFYIIKRDRANTLPEENVQTEQNIPENPPVVEEKPEEEPVVEEENKVNNYEAVFYSDEVERKNSYCVMKANLVNVDTGEEDLRRIKIDKNTEIRKNGDRIILDAFITLVEELAGEQLVYSVEINEEEDYASKISFNGDFSEEEPEEEVVEDETVEEAPVEEAPVEESVQGEIQTTTEEQPSEETAE